MPNCPQICPRAASKKYVSELTVQGVPHICQNSRGKTIVKRQTASINATGSPHSVDNRLDYRLSR